MPYIRTGQQAPFGQDNMPYIRTGQQAPFGQDNMPYIRTGQQAPFGQDSKRRRTLPRRKEGKKEMHKIDGAHFFLFFTP